MSEDGVTYGGATAMNDDREFDFSRDAGDLLHKALMLALKRRGLAHLHHPCPHCGKLATARLAQYPEIRMACSDAVAAWMRASE